MRLIFFLLTAFFLGSCNSNNRDNISGDLVSIQLGELTDISVINDAASLIDGAIYTYQRLDDNRVIISDQKPGLYMLEGNVITSVYGREGQGPCEYTRVSGIDVKDDKLYVLVTDQTKIITYDLNTQECLDEFTSAGLNRFTYLHKTEEENAFIIGNASYIGLMPDSTSLLRKIYTNGDYEELGFELGRINTVRSAVRLIAPGMEFIQDDNKLYGYFPLTDSLYSFDLNTSTIGSFPLDIEIQREELEEAMNSSELSVESILEIINNGYTFVIRVLISDDWIGVATAQNMPDSDERDQKLKFFRHDGTYIGEVPYENNILGEENGRLVQVIENNDPNAEFGYSLGYRDVIIE